MSRVGFPLLLIPLAVFNIMVFLMSGVSFDASVVAVPLLSGTRWTVSVSDMLLAIAVLLLMFEIIRGARGKYLTDHLLSLLLLGGAAAEFLLLPQFGNSTFFFLALLTFVDFFAGLALRAKRPARAAKPVVGTPVPEPYQPRVEPAPAPVPAAPETPVASSAVPTPRAEPVIVPPVVAANDSETPPAPETPAR
ncbi:MAG: hypothetical protein M9932_16100 [Xanthobacteraceae bacterium]|nr:hypothetical protein [Xanthobacteraceae bacterium]